MQTQENQARIAAPVVINNAEAKVNATLETNKAAMESFYKVSVTEAEGYAVMKTKLGFKTDQQLLDFIRAKTINSFNPKNLIVGV